jgi:hypothetical protein
VGVEVGVVWGVCGWGGVRVVVVGGELWGVSEIKNFFPSCNLWNAWSATDTSGAQRPPSPLEKGIKEG